MKTLSQAQLAQIGGGFIVADAPQNGVDGLGDGGAGGAVIGDDLMGLILYMY